MTDPGQLFDEYASDYDATVQRAIRMSGESVAFFARLRVRLIAESLRQRYEPRAILDFGCGTGNMAREAAIRFSLARIVGTDLSAESLARAKDLSTSFGEQLQFELTGSDGLPFDDGSFDLAFTSGVFHHIDPADRLRWAAELRRVVRPGGRFYLFEHNPLNPLTVHVVDSIPFDRGVQLLRAHETVQLIRSAGFEPTRASYYFFFPHLLRALRPVERVLSRLPIGAQYFVVGVAR